MIGIIDYDAGNLASIENALIQLKAEYIISKEPNELNKADKIIFPGVGNAKAAIESLRTNYLFNFIQNYSKPLLGICLGMQLLFEYSEEDDAKCLGIIKGQVKKFNFANKKIQIPHMGWNEIIFDKLERKSKIFNNIKENSDFYFVHSYCCDPKNAESVIGITNYGDINFCSAVQKDNFYGVQFHPEKSAKNGEKLLKNFLSL